jgi:hypothetical protein
VQEVQPVKFNNRRLSLPPNITQRLTPRMTLLEKVRKN